MHTHTTLFIAFGILGIFASTEAKPLHTIDIERGLRFDWDDSTEAFRTTNEGSKETVTWLCTWDQNFIYFGLESEVLRGAGYKDDLVVSLYADFDLDKGAESSFVYQGNQNELPFGADLHVRWSPEEFAEPVVYMGYQEGVEVPQVQYSHFGSLLQISLSRTGVLQNVENIKLTTFVLLNGKTVFISPERGNHEGYSVRINSFWSLPLQPDEIPNMESNIISTKPAEVEMQQNVNDWDERGSTGASTTADSTSTTGSLIATTGTTAQETTTASQTTSPTDPGKIASPPSTDNTMLIGIIAGVGALVICALIVGICYLRISNNRKRKRQSQRKMNRMSNNNIEMRNGIVKQPSLNNVIAVPPVTYTVVKGVGVSCEQNPAYRKTMEDEHVMIDKYGDSPNQAYFAVFDGHGGKETAEFVSKQLHKTLLKELRRCFELTERSEPDQHPTIAKALQTAFLNTDNQLKEAKIDKSGSTAAVALLLKKPKDQHKMLYAANIGDTRTVLIRGNKAVRLSYDHKASSPSEAERIKADGGWVVMNKVAGILSVSRAFGNEELKQWVLADPYISETELTPEDTHLIIACDGLWDVITDEEAADLILKDKDASPQVLSDKLLKHAMDAKTRDNVSILVIQL